MNYWTQSNKNIYVAAHRGWKAKYPENTLEAFEAALALGVDQLETDVHITKDGALVLIHDATVDRTTNGTGSVSDFTLAELKTLDAGNGAKIPTLAEFMELVKDHPTITLDIELKEYPTEGRETLAYNVCDRILKMIDDYGFTDRSVINTWDGKLHEYIHKTYGRKYKQHLYYPQKLLEMFTGPCTEDPYIYGYCTCVFGILDGEISIDDAKKLQKDTGVRLWAGTYAKDEKTIDIAVEMGAELITCDNPDEVLEILRKKGCINNIKRGEFPSLQLVKKVFLTSCLRFFELYKFEKTGRSNAKDNPDGFLSHYLSLRNIWMGSSLID